MADWMIKCSELLECIYEVLRQRMVKQPCLQADETPLQVLKEPGRSPKNKSYMWVYRTATSLGSPIILYDYQTGKGHEHPEEYFPIQK